MLADPPRLHDDPILRALARAFGADVEPKEVRAGVRIIGHFSGDMLIWGRNAPEMHMGYPNLDTIHPGLNSYGVCDTPAQFLNVSRRHWRRTRAASSSPSRTWRRNLPTLATAAAGVGTSGVPTSAMARPLLSTWMMKKILPMACTFITCNQWAGPKVE